MVAIVKRAQAKKKRQKTAYIISQGQ